MMSFCLPNLCEDNISLYLIPVFWVWSLTIRRDMAKLTCAQMIAVAPRFWAAHAVSTCLKQRMEHSAAELHHRRPEPSSSHMLTHHQFESKTSEKMDTRQPREFVKTIENHASIDVIGKGRLRRAEAAVANSFENFGPFAAACVAGSAAKLNPLLINMLSIGYLVSRIAYSYLYIQADTPQKAKARTFAYLVSMGLLFTIFVKAGGEFKNGAF